MIRMNSKTGKVYEIFVNQMGYIPDCVKKAVLNFPADVFSVTDENGDIYYEGTVRHFGMDKNSGDDVYIADFSDFTRPGSYRLCAGHRRSALFHISGGIYTRLLKSVSKAYYYLRCGCSLDEKYAGRFSHGICHDRAAVIYGENTSRDVSGGWHDAGDYGRYVTAGAVAAVHLLLSYEFFPEVFRGLCLDIPESGGKLPDILSECRYELEWLMKMQREDGAAYHKVTTMKHAPFIMPEDDKEELYIFPVSSFATADLCAVCAHAARVYKGFDGEFSARLESTALKAAGWLDRNPQFIGFDNPEECNTGIYGEHTDTDNRFWAYCEMYALTGDKRYHSFLSDFSRREFYKNMLGYGATGGLGALAYIFCERDKDAALLLELKNCFIGAAYYFAELADNSGYCAAMASGDYVWGSNMALLHRAMTFIIADRLTGENRFLPYAVRQADIILGANPLGISYITGTGEYCCRDPHYRPAASDGIEESIPGFVSGGPNAGLNDEFARENIPKGTPPMKCYIDNAFCYSLNEITIYWNSPAVFTFAYLSLL